MLATIALVLGILLAIILLTIARRRTPEASAPVSKTTHLTWWTLGLGLTAVIALVVATQVEGENSSGQIFWLLSIASGFAAVVVGLVTIMKRDRHWLAWIGLIAGLVPALFWIAFALGYILGIGE